MSAPVTLTREGEAAVLTIDRGGRGNALDAALVEALHDALDAADGAPALIVTARGKGFCGGFDLGGLEAETDATLLHRFVRIEMLLQRLARFPAPTTALAHGFAFGAGADIFAACDRRIAAPGCRFSFPGARFGIVLGTARLSARAGAETARRLLESPGAVPAEQAQGLVTEIVPDADWPALRAELARAHPADPSVRGEILARSRPPEDFDAALAALTRSAARSGLAERLRAYAAAARPTTKEKQNA